MPLSSEEKEFIRSAARYLENPSFFVKLTNLVGKPLEKSVELLPSRVKDTIQMASQKAIEGALRTALTTLQTKPLTQNFEEALSSIFLSKNLHAAGTAMTGAVGGFFGLPALLVELPLTTTVMLRSIAKIASDFGEDVSRPETQLECLYVFSLGGPSKVDNEMDSAYFTSRLAFAELVKKAVSFVAGKSSREILLAVERKSAPILLDIIVKVASRFQIVVSEKAMGQLLPGIGAGAGALLNVAFTEHFNALAKYHFGLKRLERDHGKDAVLKIFQS